MLPCTGRPTCLSSTGPVLTGRRPQVTDRLSTPLLAAPKGRTDRCPTGTLPSLDDHGHAARAVFDAAAGFGPLQQYIDDPTVEEVWINDRLTGRPVLQPWHCAP
jgi:hypothetical protein